MEASLLPRKNYASAISARLNVDPIEQGAKISSHHQTTLMMILRADGKLLSATTMPDEFCR